MSLKYAARKDGNQTQIVNELRKLGFDVDIVHRLKRLYDLVVSGPANWAGGVAVAVRVEVKQPGEELSPAESEYWERQRHDNLIVAECTEDVLRWFNYA